MRAVAGIPSMVRSPRLFVAFPRRMTPPQSPFVASFVSNGSATLSASAVKTIGALAVPWASIRPPRWTTSTLATPWPAEGVRAPFRMVPAGMMRVAPLST